MRILNYYKLKPYTIAFIAIESMLMIKIVPFGVHHIIIKLIEHQDR
jgi:hypothetical protein